MRYDVGQVVFLLSKKDMKVFPAQVVEEIISKKLDGENITYMAKLPNKDRTEVSLSEVSADVFRDAGSLKRLRVVTLLGLLRLIWGTVLRQRLILVICRLT